MLKFLMFALLVVALFNIQLQNFRLSVALLLGCALIAVVERNVGATAGCLVLVAGVAWMEWGHLWLGRSKGAAAKQQ